MKKLIAIVLALVMVMALAACTTNPPASTPAPTTTGTPAPTTTVTPPPPTDPVDAIPAGTSWNAIETYDKEGKEDSVWKYEFFDGNDSSYNPMGGYEERNDGSLCSWYPWEGCWVGLGFNKDVEGYLEMNSDGTAMTSILVFVAPADGEYVITGQVWNPWSQPCDKFTVSKVEAAKASDIKEAGTVVLEQEIAGFEAIYGYLTSTKVELKKGDLLRFKCPSTDGNWVSAYANVTMHYKPTDPSVYETPENPTPPEQPVEPTPGVDGALYSATGDFSRENNNGVWVYASTFDGINYTLNNGFDAPTGWDDDPEEDAAQWYSDGGTGVGFNFDVADYLEVNVNNGNGEMAALGFKAPAAGTYKLTVFTKNMWGQDSNGVIVHLNGEDIATIPFVEAQTVQEITVTLAEGDIVYFHGTSNGEWVSTYMAVFVSEG